MRPVSKAEYGVIRDCWRNSEDDTMAFIVFAERGNAAVPYFISAKCYADGYSQPGEEVIDILGAYKIDSTGDLFDHYIGRHVISNTITDLPAPEDDSTVFYFIGKVSQNSSGENEVDSVKSFINSGLDFGQFLTISPEARYVRARALRLRNEKKK